MRFLVTGGAGFVGSSFAHVALKNGHEVIAIDNLSTGKISNIEEYLSNPRFEFVKHDLSTSFPLLNNISAQGTYICHFAAQVGVESVVSGVTSSIRNNIHVSEQVVKYAREYSIPVLFTSSSEIYGKSVSLPSSEQDDRRMGAGSVYRWAYAETKVLDELLFKELWERHSVPTISLRLFNTVGPRQSADYGMVIPRFVKQAISGEPMTIYGNGQQSRTFCSVFDVIEAMFGLMSTESAFGEVFNVGSTYSITILELAKKIHSLVQSTSKIVHIDPIDKLGFGFEEIPHRSPSIDKIHNLIGWKPLRSIDDIVKDVIADIRKY